jgi:hypothetical protein
VGVSAPVSVTVANGGGGGSPGLVAAFGFDEGSGSSVVDASGNGNVGVVNGPVRVAGRFGGGLRFAGSFGNAVVVPSSASLNSVSSAFTVSAWVNLTSTSGWRTVVMREAGVSSYAYGLYARNGAGGYPSLWVNLSGDQDLYGDAPMPTGVWVYLAASFDGSVLRFYRDGVLEDSRLVGGVLPVSSQPLRIGGNQVWGEWLAGVIDEVRVYNRALSQPEIAADMTSPITP